MCKIFLALIRFLTTDLGISLISGALLFAMVFNEDFLKK